MGRTIILVSLLFQHLAFAEISKNTIAQNKLLQKHPSPYLRSHANDPINWQLIRQIKKGGDKPVFISSGYEACYWCYRMKVDTFSNNALAKKINKTFTAIIIDREIHSQIDQQLQVFVTEQRGFGGWPLNVVLTPDGDPILGFSYTDAKSFENLVDSFAVKWKEDQRKITNIALEFKQSRFKKYKDLDTTLETVNPQALLLNFLKQISKVSDVEYGGFGDSEKFPNTVQLSALLDLYSINPDKPLASFLELTLDNMLHGGIRDQLAGGFFRYSDHQNWHAPHYEQMLYTQALMGKLLIRAGQALKRTGYLIAGKEVLLNMVSRFRENGRFYHASLSAVGEDKTSGGYYLWTKVELIQLLGKNWRQKVKNRLPSDSRLVLPLLIEPDPRETKNILLEARKKRVQLVDDKKLLAWQGLVLSGLSYGAQMSPELAKAAETLAGNLFSLIDNGQLSRVITRDNKDDTYNDLESLVYVAQGMFDWWQLSADRTALDSTKKLLLKAYQNFYKDGRWLASNENCLLTTTATLAIADTQLPSPTALWLSLSWTLADIDKSSELLISLADKAGDRLPSALSDNTFFHASLLSTLIIRQLQFKRSHK